MKSIFNKLKTVSPKKWAIILIVLFIAIVSGVTISSKILNDKATSVTTRTIESSKKAIFEDDSEEQTLASKLDDDGVEYEKVTDKLYVATFESRDDLTDAVEKYSSDEVKVVEDSVFVTLTDAEKSDEEEKKGCAVSVKGSTELAGEIPQLNEELPESYTWKQLAEERGQKLVAVIDTEISGYATKNYNFTTEEISECATGTHGTLVAKQIYDNADGKALIIGLKAMRRDGYGYMTDVMKAVQFAKDELHADVINMSIATDADDNKEAFVEQIKDVVSSGITVVAAAGNYASDVSAYYPAGIDGVIAVGTATDGTKTTLSNYGDIDYYEDADSTSEAAGIITGKIVADVDLSDIATKENIIIKDEDRADENTKISGTTEIKNGEVEIQRAGQIGTIYTNNRGTAYIGWITYGNCYNTDDDVWQYANAWDGYQWSNANCPCTTGMIVYSATGYNGWVSDGTMVVRNFWTAYAGCGDGTKEVNSCSIIPKTDGSTTVTINFRAAKLSVNLNGGSWTGSTSYTATGTNSNVSLPTAVPTRTGYTFKGWTLSGGGSYNSGTGVYSYGNSDGTLTANWEDNTYLMYCNPTGGTLSGGNFGSDNETTNTTYVKVRYGTNDYSQLGTAKRTGYEFIGWGTEKQTDEQMSTGTIAGEQVFRADGWAINPYVNSSLYQNGFWVHLGDATIYAQWKRLDYHITMNLNDSNGAGGIKASLNGIPNSVTVTYGTNTNNSLGKKPTRKGYTFLGWYTAATGGTQVYDANGNHVNDTTHWKSDVWNLTSDMTLYAHWQATKYNVAYRSNGTRHVRAGTNVAYNKYTSDTTQRVSGSMTANTSVTYDASFTLNGNGYAWDGHTWKGWSENSQASSASYSNKQNFSYGQIVEANGRYWDYNAEKWKNADGSDLSTITLYSVWNANSYTLKIDPVNGSGTWSSTGNVTTKTVYWGDKQALGTATPANKSLTITYNANGDNVVLDRSSDTVRWRFNRWKRLHTNDLTNKDNSDGYNANTDNYPDDVNKYSNRTDSNITNGVFMNNDANGNANAYYAVQNTSDTLQALYYYEAVTLPTPTREGYNFLGWYTDEACTQKARGYRNESTGNGGASFRATENVTLYARWEKTSYDYDETMQSFMQDEETGSASVYLAKVNALTGTPMSTTDGSFVIGIYKNSVSDANLVLKLDTAKGLYNASNTLVQSVSSDGYYDITKLLDKNTTYVAHEISAPAGWLLDKDQTFTFDSKQSLKVEIKDKQTTTLPKGKTFVKEDAYGRTIANATFELKDITDNKVIKSFTTTEDGTFSSELFDYCVAGHKYTLTETKAPEGYGLISPITFTMPKYSTDDEIQPIYAEETTQTTGSLQIKKVNSDDEPLQGAEFQLFMKNDEGELIPCYKDASGNWVDATEEDEEVQNGTYTLMTATTGSDGIATFKNLPLRANFTGSEEDFTKSYYLKEIKAPEGYSILTDEFEIRLPESSVNGMVQYTVKDESVVLTLEAGGTGITTYALIGSGLLGLAVIMVVTKKRKRNA